MIVQIFTTPNCFKCRDAKLLLEKEGIKYEELDAIKHKDEMGDKLELPIIKFGDKFIDLEEIINFKWISDHHKLCP